MIYKVGVAVLDDAEKLLIDHNLEVSGCLDLRHLAVRQASVPGKLGLQSLAQEYLGVHLDKVGKFLSWYSVSAMFSGNIFRE